jgi:AcrR family transcriptional regulator
VAGGGAEHREGPIDRHVAHRAAKSRGRPRDPETDASIIQAALDLFIEHGIDGTSIEQIARRAGVARLTVYRRWSTKEELLVQAMETARGTVPDAAEVAAALAGVPPAAAAENLVELWAGVMMQPDFVGMVSRLVGSSRSHPALLEAYWRSSIQPRREAAKPLVALLAGASSRGNDPDLIMDMLAGSVLYRVLVNPEPIGPEDMREYLWSLLRQLGFSFSSSKTSNQD